MLDAFKKTISGQGPSRKAADELEEMLLKARVERAALTNTLSQVEMQASRLSDLEQRLGSATGQAAAAVAQIEKVTERLGQVETRLAVLGDAEQRLKSLKDGLKAAEQQMERVSGPDGDLTQHKALIAQLSQQALQARASLDAMKSEQSQVEEAREQLRSAAGELKGAAERADTLRTDVEALRITTTTLAQDATRIRELSREAKDEVTVAVDAVKDVEKKLGPLAHLQELSKNTEERLTALNTLAEHVGQKVKLLEAQKHTVEHAVVEANRLNEMVWAMDAQINRLNDGNKQMQRTQEMIDRIEKLSRDVHGSLEGATRAKDAFAQDIARLDRDRGSLTEFITRYTEQLMLQRRDFDAHEQRLVSVKGAVDELDRGLDA
ncbi:MAG: hypothetical protein JNM38_17865, partial [Acidobacteria bacterium]|nr:hypothetical protein [Acidobacteriota bacterium]